MGSTHGRQVALLFWKKEAKNFCDFGWERVLVDIRAATIDDVGAIAAVDRAARSLALPSVRWAHGWDEVPGWIGGVLIPRGGVFVAELDRRIVGYMALHEGWIDALYLHPDVWRSGIGTAFVAHAKTLRPTGLQLWCFQVNARARAFYLRQGFVVAELTDGAGNEELEPDIRFVWAG